VVQEKIKLLANPRDKKKRNFTDPEASGKPTIQAAKGFITNSKTA
jgi:hypothetical protein